MTRILLIAISAIGYMLAAAYVVAVVAAMVILLSACGGHASF